MTTVMTVTSTVTRRKRLIEGAKTLASPTSPVFASTVRLDRHLVVVLGERRVLHAAVQPRQVAGAAHDEVVERRGDAGGEQRGRHVHGDDRAEHAPGASSPPGTTRAPDSIAAAAGRLDERQGQPGGLVDLPRRSRVRVRHGGDHWWAGRVGVRGRKWRVEPEACPQKVVVSMHFRSRPAARIPLAVEAGHQHAVQL